MNNLLVAGCSVSDYSEVKMNEIGHHLLGNHLEQMFLT